MMRSQTVFALCLSVMVVLGCAIRASGYLVEIAAHAVPGPREIVVLHIQSHGAVPDAIGGPPSATIAKLASMLPAASRRGETVAIVSQNPKFSGRALAGALEQIGEGELSGLTIILVGREEDRARIERLVETCGASFAFAAQPPSP